MGLPMPKLRSCGRAAYVMAATLLATAVAAAPRRPVPAECGADAAAAPANPERAWHEHFRAGFEAIETGALDQAHAEICAALLAAAGFEPRDWRFAETLDELGLIDYLLGDDDASAAAQASAVAEMLLAKGPRAAEVELYAARLAYPLARAGRDAQAKSLAAAPHGVFTQGLVPVSPETARRLDWLVAEYLRIEEVAIARELQDVIAKASEESRR